MDYYHHPAISSINAPDDVTTNISDVIQNSIESHLSLLQDNDDDEDGEMMIKISEQEQVDTAESIASIQTDTFSNTANVPFHTDDGIDRTTEDHAYLPLPLQHDYDTILEEASKWIAEMEYVRDIMIWCRVENACHRDIFSMHNIDSL